MMDLIVRTPRLPTLGETLVGRSFQLGYGGKGANQATAAARLGARVSMVAKVGHDVFGAGAVQNLRDNRVDTTWVGVHPHLSSGVAPIFVDDRAQNAIVIVPGANDGLTPEDVRTAQSAILSADFLCCQAEVPPETTLEAFRIAAARDVTTVLNPAPAVALPEELFALTSICVANEVEVEVLTGVEVRGIREAAKAARTLRARGPGTVILTLGNRGALLYDGDIIQHVEAIQVDSVDPTGAGDAFIGALIVFLGEGRRMVDAVRAAGAVAALSVTRMGTQVSFPIRSEADDFIRAHLPPTSEQGGRSRLGLDVQSVPTE